MTIIHRKIESKYKERKQVPSGHNLKWVLPIFVMVGFYHSFIVSQGKYYTAGIAMKNKIHDMCFRENTLLLSTNIKKVTGCLLLSPYRSRTPEIK
jgi:hypothetical protein